jgi:hypothetical protein
MNPPNEMIVLIALDSEIFLAAVAGTATTSPKFTVQLPLSYVRL